MKITEVQFSLKKGLPNFSSVMASITVSVDEKDNVDQAWDMAKNEVMRQCNEDASWLNSKQPNEPTATPIQTMSTGIHRKEK